MNKYEEMVKQCHQAMEMSIDAPYCKTLLELRKRLIEEEVNELKYQSDEFAEFYPDEDPEMRPNRKVTADLYIDDRNLGGLPDWGIIYEMVHTGRYNQPVPTANMVNDTPHSRKKQSFLFRLFGV